MCEARGSVRVYLIPVWMKLKTDRIRMCLLRPGVAVLCCIALLQSLPEASKFGLILSNLPREPITT